MAQHAVDYRRWRKMPRLRKTVVRVDAMMVMPSNQMGFLLGWVAGRFPGRFGFLLTATDWAHHPNPDNFSFIPWAMDNGKFACWSAGKTWDEAEFWKRAEQPRKHRPGWVVVPDVVADRDGTLREWERCSKRLLDRGHTLAMAVQDGMTPADVPDEASVVFVGGTTKWKWRNLPMWAATGRRLHVARVGSERMLWMAHEAGAESCDSTGWGREGYGSGRIAGLLRYLEQSSNGGRPQMTLQGVMEWTDGKVEQANNERGGR
jgi:hypothetical protein